jgi:Fe-S cluster assembly ATP-binding protein
MALMDETDSGLDIDALRIVSEGVNTLRGEDPKMGVLLITHYKRILGYLQPDHVHVMLNGRIAHSGGPELADQLEEMGYDWLHEPEPQPVG